MPSLIERLFGPETLHLARVHRSGPRRCCARCSRCAAVGSNSCLSSRDLLALIRSDRVRDPQPDGGGGRNRGPRPGAGEDGRGEQMHVDPLEAAWSPSCTVAVSVAAPHAAFAEASKASSSTMVFFVIRLIAPDRYGSPAQARSTSSASSLHSAIVTFPSGRSVCRR